MTKVTVQAGALDLLESQVSTDFRFDFDHAAALSELPRALDGAVRALQLSAGLIRAEFTTPTLSAPYELRIASFGIGPISALEQLRGALDRALEAGRIAQVTALTSGQEVLNLGLASNGLQVTSGGQSLTLLGTRARDFDALKAMQDSLTQAGDFDTMTHGARRDWLAALEAEGTTGLALRDGGALRFGFELTETTAWMQLGGMRLWLTGSFSTGMADVAGKMMQALQSFSATGAWDLQALQGLSLDTALVRDAAGADLLRITEWDNGRLGYWLGDQRHDEWLTGGRGAQDEILTGRAGAVSSLLTGMAGDDLLAGLEGRDGLYGGAGQDTLVGGAGHDLLDGGAGRDWARYDGFAAVRVDLRVTGAQATGQGRDQLLWIENLMGGALGDWLRGNPLDNVLMGRGGADTLDGGAGQDHLIGGIGADLLIGGPGRDTLEGGSQADTMTGGAGADVFVFQAGGGGLALGLDLITDFDPTQDILSLVTQGPAPVWSGLDAEAFVQRFALVVGDHVEIRLAPGQVITLEGVTSLDGLAAAITGL